MILNPAKKKSDSDEENRGEDWEMLSGSKSLTAMADQQNTKEQAEEGEKDETWYKTIPATPNNTPVETPPAPVYPTQQEATAGTNLPPIKEEPSQPPRFEEEYTPSTSEDEEYLACVERAVESVIQATGRVFLYVIVIFTLKWLVSNVWRKIQSIRASWH